MSKRIITILAMFVVTAAAFAHYRRVVLVDSPSDIHRQSYVYVCSKCGKRWSNNGMFYSDNMGMWYKYKNRHGVKVLQPVDKLPSKCVECSSSDDLQQGMIVAGIIALLLVGGYILETRW